MTDLSKPHFPVLDGLRGLAAILVVIFHLFEGFDPSLEHHPMRHGYLAVDFFFLLSGYVIGYAYDDRWWRMGMTGFLRIRLTRLHPLVVMGTMIGAIVFLCDPFTEGRPEFTITGFLFTIVVTLTLLPSPDVRGWGETHSLNGPGWSLLQEYLANLLYAVALRRLSDRWLGGVVVMAAILTISVAAGRGDLGTGWSFQTFPIAMVRMLFPFTAGLWLYRMRVRVHTSWPAVFCSALLIATFFIPWIDGWNGWVESACIILVFPVIVAIGAGATVSERMKRICDRAGAISYPLYITHYPFIYVYTEWIWFRKPSAETVIPAAICLLFGSVVLAWLALKWYDIPVRRWLNTTTAKPQNS